MKLAFLMLDIKDRGFYLGFFMAIFAKMMIFRMISTAIISVVK